MAIITQSCVMCCSHHKTPVKRFFSGSSSIFAVKHCEQPVVVVP